MPSTLRYHADLAAIARNAARQQQRQLRGERGSVEKENVKAVVVAPRLQQLFVRLDLRRRPRPQRRRRAP
jgi:hypothetical protein